jgi:hypothetical protein
MWWYAPKIKRHLEMVLSSFFWGLWKTLSNFLHKHSKIGLVSTAVAGPEFPPTMALKRITIISVTVAKQVR